MQQVLFYLISQHFFRPSWFSLFKLTKMTLDNVMTKESLVVTEKPFLRQDILICSTHGNIYAIHKSDGSRLWKAKFPTGSLGGVVSLFITENDKLIVGANRKTCCMDLLNGKVAWVNKMLVYTRDKINCQQIN